MTVLLLGQKHVKVKFCSCFEELDTLIRLKLFPATPKKPSLVFTFKLFDWLEAVILECHIAVGDFVTALHKAHEGSEMKVNKIQFNIICRF